MHTKDRIAPSTNEIVIVSVKAIESWFIADGETLSKIVKHKTHVDHPEEIDKPFQWIKNKILEKRERGINKLILAKRMIDQGFSVENAARHPHSHSAQYFINKLKELAN